MKKIIFINFLIFFLIILSIEIFLRFFLNITPQGISSGIINENSSKPTFNYTNVEKGKIFGKRVFTDKNGFRVAKNKKNNKDKKNQENIYFVGGSVTFGSGVDQSKTFSGIINKKFENLNIYNAGVMGSNLANNYYIIKNKVKTENLKKIYVNFSLDDISSSEILVNAIDKEDMNKTQKNNFIKKIKNNPAIRKVNIFIRSKSVLYVVSKSFILGSQKGYYIQARDTFRKTENIDYMKKYLDMIKNYNDEIDNKIVFLVIPYSYQIKDQNCKSDDYAENIIKNELYKREIKFYKIKDLFCNEDKKDKIYLTLDPAHMSKYGHKILANYLSNDLK